MLYTQYFNFPIYEGKDYVNYMVTYNDTIKSLDETLHIVKEQMDISAVNFEKINSDIESIKKSLETNIQTVENLSSAVTVNSKEISSISDRVNEINKDLLAQNQLIQKLDSTTVTLTEKLSNIQSKLTELEKTVTDLSSDYANTKEKTYENSSKILKLENNSPVESFIVKNSNINKLLEYSCSLDDLPNVVCEITTPLGCYSFPTLTVGNPTQSISIPTSQGNATITFLTNRNTDGTFNLILNSDDILPNVSIFKIYQF